jgi:hypothetical protein
VIDDWAAIHNISDISHVQCQHCGETMLLQTCPYFVGSLLCHPIDVNASLEIKLRLTVAHFEHLGWVTARNNINENALAAPWDNPSPILFQKSQDDTPPLPAVTPTEHLTKA